MKKNFFTYLISWSAVLALFNLFIFITPSQINGVSKFGGLFWFCYSLITLCFVAQLICTYFIFKTKSLKKVFYSIPLLFTSYFALAVMLLVGGLCMAIVQLPDWIGVIVCCVALVFNVLAYAKSSLAVQMIDSLDREVKEKTLFIKMLTAEAQALSVKAQNDETKNLAFKVYEAIRYSDPMSSSLLKAVEDRISVQFEEFSKRVISGDMQNINACFTELMSSITERNEKCKILK